MSGVSSNLLKEKKETILSLWEERCEVEVKAARGTVSLALRNSLPIYLDHLSEALAKNLRMDFKSVYDRDKEAKRIGRLHGADRASNRSYVLTEVIFEYHILREVIFQVMEGAGDLSNVHRDIILDSLEQAVNDAAVEFSEIHTDIQQKFVSTLTHDLKHPITAAKLNAQLLMKIPKLSLTESRCGLRIIGSMNRLESMIHDLLDASRLHAGESLALVFAECDLDSLLRDVVDEMAVIHGDRFVLESENSVIGKWDKDGLRRAVENLIGNAVKYGATDQPITVSLNASEKLVQIAVHNLGNPIPKEEVPLLFEDFRRSKSALERSKTGWGLGLTIVKGVVEAHQGKVWVESSKETGTKFVIQIPL